MLRIAHIARESEVVRKLEKSFPRDRGFGFSVGKIKKLLSHSTFLVSSETGVSRKIDIAVVAMPIFRLMWNERDG